MAVDHQRCLTVQSIDGAVVVARQCSDRVGIPGSSAALRISVAVVEPSTNPGSNCSAAAWSPLVSRPRRQCDGGEKRGAQKRSPSLRGRRPARASRHRHHPTARVPRSRASPNSPASCRHACLVIPGLGLHRLPHRVAGRGARKKLRTASRRSSASLAGDARPAGSANPVVHHVGSRGSLNPTNGKSHACSHGS